MICEPTIVTRADWLDLPDGYRAGIGYGAYRPISEREFACHVHYLLDGCESQPEAVEVRTEAAMDVVIVLHGPNPKLFLAAAKALEAEWDREMLPVGLKLSFDANETG